MSGADGDFRVFVRGGLVAVSTVSGNVTQAFATASTRADAVGRVGVLDALRGLAALVVVLTHGREVFFVGTLPYLKTHPFDVSPGSLLAYATAPLMSGAIGVCVLFVLSGYVIHRPNARPLAAESAPFDAGSFYLRRLVRIYPTLLLALVMTLICDEVARGFVDHPKLGDTSAQSFAASLLALQGLIAEPYGSNSPLWSLAIEIQFYLVYPLALVAWRRLGPERMLAATAAASLIGAWACAQFDLTMFAEYYLAWWLGAYIADREVRGLPLARYWPWIAAVSIAAGCISYQYTYCYLGRMLWALGLAPLLMYLMQRNVGWLAGSSLLKELGQFSYTLYAVHFPIMVLLSAVLFAGVKQPNILWALGLSCVATAACYPAYLLAEKPSVAWLARLRNGASGGAWEDAAMFGMTGFVGRWNARRLARAVQTYPVFHPPFPTPPALRTDEETHANYAYFLSQRADRVADLKFLLEQFGTDATDAQALDHWVAAFGAGLIPSEAHVHALTTHSPAWTGRYASLNVVHDLAVALGEAAMQQDHRWTWACDPLATGSGALLIQGARRVDLVAEVAQCLRSPELRRAGLQRSRQFLSRA